MKKNDLNPNFNKDCLDTGFKPGVQEINAVLVERELRFGSSLFELHNAASDFNQLISAFLPYPVIRLDKLPRSSAVESKQPVPTYKELLRLANAYANHRVDEYLVLEEAVCKKTGIKDSKILMDFVLKWLVIFSLITNLKEGRCFTALSYEMSGNEWKSLNRRFLKSCSSESKHHLTETELEEISAKIWKVVSKESVTFQINPGFSKFLSDLAPYVDNVTFAAKAMIAFIELDKTQRDPNKKIDISMSGRLKAFVESFSKGKDIHGKINLTGTKPGTSSKVYLTECSYGKPFPSGVIHKNDLYFFASAAILAALHLQKTFRFSENVCAYFCLFWFQHMPLFNLHTDFKYTKQSRLWPFLKLDGDDAEFIVSSLSFVQFIKQALRRHGPINYKGWIEAGCPEDLTPFNSLENFKEEVLRHKEILAGCSRSFMSESKKNDKGFL